MLKSTNMTAVKFRKAMKLLGENRKIVKCDCVTSLSFYVGMVLSTHTL